MRDKVLKEETKNATEKIRNEVDKYITEKVEIEVKSTRKEIKGSVMLKHNCNKIKELK